MSGFLGDCRPNRVGRTNDYYWVYPNQKILKCEEFSPVFEECIAVNVRTIDCQNECVVTKESIQSVTVEAKNWEFLFPMNNVLDCEQTVILKVEYEATVKFRNPRCEDVKRSFDVCHQLTVGCDLTECDRKRFEFEPFGARSTNVIDVISVPGCPDLRVIKFRTRGATHPLGTVQGIKCCDVAVPAVNVSTDCNTPEPTVTEVEDELSDGKEEV